MKYPPRIEARKTPDGRTHHIVITTDSVAILVYNKDTDELLFVRQNRPATITSDNPLGTLVEVCAGRIDREGSVEEIAQAELWEEMGITVELSAIQTVYASPAFFCPGVLSEQIHFRYVVITNTNRDMDSTDFGLAEEGEHIKIVTIPRDQIKVEDFHDLKTRTLLQWFLSQERK